MYKKTIDLTPNERLLLTWQKHFAAFTISCNGQILGSFPDKASMKTGANFDLPGGRKVFVILQGGRPAVWLDGTDLITGTQSGISLPFYTGHISLILWGVLLSLIDLLAVRSLPVSSSVFLLLVVPALVAVALSSWIKATQGKNAVVVSTGWIAVIEAIRWLVFGFRPVNLILSLTTIYSMFRNHGDRRPDWNNFGKTLADSPIK